ncbi:hypothetical protein LIER_08421 [Lithospermum erythrorhizon]|uniref:Uncharacterized protein n=1 Tax=Lithospermum erythrorhizon TaxID=34254 RepID=A0AAV3PG88_LITER
MYGPVVRGIGVTSLPSLECLPIAINLKNRLPDLELGVFNIYNPLLYLIRKPTDTEFREVFNGLVNTGI